MKSSVYAAPERLVLGHAPLVPCDSGPSRKTKKTRSKVCAKAEEVHQHALAWPPVPSSCTAGHQISGELYSSENRITVNLQKINHVMVKKGRGGGRRFYKNNKEEVKGKGEYCETMEEPSPEEQPDNDPHRALSRCSFVARREMSLPGIESRRRCDQSPTQRKRRGQRGEREDVET